MKLSKMRVVINLGMVCGKSFSNAQQMKFVYPTMTAFMAMIVKNAHKKQKFV